MSATSHDRSGPRSTRQSAQPEGSSNVNACPTCQQPLVGEAVAGMCPKCLMGLAMTDTIDALDDLTDSTLARTAGGLPTRFGRYTILGQLGRGAMGVVHLAKDDELDRMVAIKVPLFGRCDEDAVYRRFQREVRAAAGLRHPNICPIYDVGQIDGTVFMSMAYIAGRPLSEFIAADKEFPIRQLVQLVRKLTMALQEAHRHGIVHRDLKPSNIMVDQRGEPLIMDFGLASRNREDGPRVTQSGAILGTPAYMAPEQLAGQETGPAGDIYAMGVVFYELLTGQLPFQGDLVELVAQVARDEPRPPSDFRPDVPSQLDDICRQALAKKPQDRFPSMETFAQELARFLTDSAVGENVQPVTQIAPVEPSTLPSARWWHHMLASVGGIVLASVAVVLVCLGFGMRSGEPNPTRASPITKNRENARFASSSDNVTKQLSPSQAAQPAAETGEIETSATELTTGTPQIRTQSAELPPAASLSVPSPENSLANAVPAIASELGASELGEGTPSADAHTPPARSTRDDETAIEAESVTADIIEMDTPKTATLTPSPALTAPKSIDEKRNAFFLKALDELRGIAFERRTLIEKTKQAIARHDVELPDAFVKERGNLATLNRTANELRSEALEVEGRVRELSIENSRRDLSVIDRLANTADIKRLRQLQAIQLNKLNALAIEISGKERTLSTLQQEQQEVAAELQRLATDSPKLLERAFWAADPTGTFSKSQYEEISQLFADWLRDGIAPVEVRALYAISLANAGKLKEARTVAGQANADNGKSAIAAAALGYVKAQSGETTEGLRDLSRATRLADRFAAAYVLRATANRQLMRHEAALVDLKRAAKLEPNNLSTKRLMALHFAASPIASQRDPDLAVSLAKSACEMTEFQDWYSLDILAAAYASSGDFGKAIETQRMTLDLAPDRVLESVRERLRSYQENRIFLLD